MDKNEYLQYINNKDVLSIIYSYYKEHRDTSKKVVSQEHIKLFLQSLPPFIGQNMLNACMSYYDSKFNITKLIGKENQLLMMY